MIGENSTKFENSEETIYLNSNNMVLNTPIKNITSIELKDFEFPFDKYNITPNNCTLEFCLSEAIGQNQNMGSNDLIPDFSQNTFESVSQFMQNSNPDTKQNSKQKPNIDSDTADLIDSETESLAEIEYDAEERSVKLIIKMGNYNMDQLTETVNKHLSKYGIIMSYSKTTNIVSFKQKDKKNFDLVFGDNTMFINLGFSLSNKSKYTSSNKYSSSKAYDFKIDKILNIYIDNINSSKPLMQYITNCADPISQTKKVVFTPVISELETLNLRFVDSKSREYVFDPENGLEYSGQIIIRYINNNQNLVKNELNEISSDDIFTIVKENVKSSRL
jgi:hypothetical protein